MPYKHGHYKEPWYGSYRSMMDRCYRKKAGNYWDYGAKGIIVCDEWHDIEKFKQWVELSGYEKGLTIDRIDVFKGYSPDNCRWATKKLQANNRSSARIIEYNGERHSVTEWSKITGISRRLLLNRLWLGWKEQDIFCKVKFHNQYERVKSNAIH